MPRFQLHGVVPEQCTCLMTLLERSELRQRPRVHHTAAKGRCVESGLQDRYRNRAFGNETGHRRIGSRGTGVEPSACTLANANTDFGKSWRRCDIVIYVVRECEGIYAMYKRLVGILRCSYIPSGKQWWNRCEPVVDQQMVCLRYT
jgi:hypothetical protein